ncbi:uncharacterized protein LOC106153889 [Lingula anatina]|uniref:Uncharacterized protein LOC106153889 n=1 Tax=Lingula anatina TaxID=7574 RepID=A0A1S3HBR5_LINAN|nr:uncharacterized protein LOC106153889 [Lingula anatina]XP_013383473.1 uncharacterized protein LOC106153889 [Lingula anatina]|eukprot:XP_013383472.1 uncharacterized protein LOC106153889 [Lingula anatina]
MANEDENSNESSLDCLQGEDSEQALDMTSIGVITTTLDLPSSLSSNISEEELLENLENRKVLSSLPSPSTQPSLQADILAGKIHSAMNASICLSGDNISQQSLLSSDMNSTTDNQQTSLASSDVHPPSSNTNEPSMCSIIGLTGKVPRKSTPRKIQPKPSPFNTIETVSPLQQAVNSSSRLNRSISMGNELEKTVYVVTVDNLDILNSLQESGLHVELATSKAAGSPPHQAVVIENHFNDTELLGSVAAETEVTTTFQGLADLQRASVSQGGCSGGLATLDAIGTIIDVQSGGSQLWETTDVVKMPGVEDSSDNDLNTSQESFVALVPLGDGSLPLTPREQELALRSFNKRMRDREKKRLLRKDPDYRLKEKEAAKQRMKLRRLDPLYREHERQRDRARRRVVRETNPNQRAKERERDRIYKRRHRVLSVDYVMSEVEVSDSVNESLSAFCSDIVDLPSTAESNS